MVEILFGISWGVLRFKIASIANSFSLKYVNKSLLLFKSYLVLPKWLYRENHKHPEVPKT